MKLLNKIALTSALAATMIAGEVTAATEWNVSLWGARRAFTENVEKLAELVAAKTNGDFKLNISYGGLSKPKENLDGITIGAFEMAQFCSFYHSDKNPTITVSELPYLKNVSLARIAEITSAVHKHPAVVKDLARWNATLLMPSPLPQYNIIGKGNVIKELTDFSGVRVRGAGGMMDVLEALGAVKTSVPFGEVRQSMDSGVIDAAAFAPHAHLATKTIDIGSYATTNLNLGTADCPVAVNTDALAALKPAHRDALLGSVDEAMKHYVDNYNSKTTAKYEAAVKEKGLALVTFTPEQTAELDKLSATVLDKWVEDNSKNFDAKELLEFTRKLYNQ